MLTCKQFLQELNDYLDPNVDAEMKRHLESHVTQCPNCFVIVEPGATVEMSSDFGALFHAWSDAPIDWADGARRPDLFGF